MEVPVQEERECRRPSAKPTQQTQRVTCALTGKNCSGAQVTQADFDGSTTSLSFDGVQQPNPCPSLRQTCLRIGRNVWPLPPIQKLEDDAARGMDLTIDDDDEDAYESRQLYSILYTSIVGVRHYKGEAAIGEYVVVRRDPRNLYDHNAICIDNVRQQRMGHLGREVAAIFAPLMDSGELVIEGALTGAKNEFQRPIGLKLFGTVSHPEKWALRSKMLAKGLPVRELDRAEGARQKKQRALAKQQTMWKHVAFPMHEESQSDTGC